MANRGLYDRVALGFLSASIFMGKAYETLLPALDSSTYARLALDSTRGALALPIGDARLGNGFWPVGFNDHPFTLIWLSGKFMRWFGPSAFSARFLASLCGVIAVLAVYQFGVSVVKSRAAGLVGAILFLSTPLFVSSAARFQLDSAMLAGIALSFVGYFSWNLPLTLVGIALGVWTKGPLGFLVFPSALFALLVCRRKDKKEWKKFFLYSTAGVVVGSLIWIAIGFIGSWNLVSDYWGRWIFGQVAKNGNGSDLGTFTFINLGTFSFILKKNFLWIGWLAAILWIGRRKKLYMESAFIAALGGAGIVFFLVFFMRAKFEHYYLPCFLALSLAAGFAFRDWAERRVKALENGVLLLAIVVPTVLLVTPIPLGVEMFPQLRRWIPFIQHHGNCHDRIVLVDSGVPYGSVRDYAAILEFYTNRLTYGAAGCDGLRQAVAANPAPDWIIVGASLPEACWQAPKVAPYFREFQYGSQILLGRVDLSQGPVDLSFLEDELRAVADCEIPTPRPNRYYRPASL